MARQEIQSVGGAPEPLGAAAVCVAAVWALGVLWAGVPTFAENNQLGSTLVGHLLSYQSSGPSSGCVHLLFRWSNTRPSVQPSSLGVVENSQTIYFLQEEGWGKEGWARAMPLGPIVSPSGHSNPSILGLAASFSHFLAKEEACSSLTQVPWASSNTSGGGQS